MTLTKPNIIWIVTDDQESGTSDEPITMPYLTSNPYGGWVRFPNATLTTPLCAVARANMLSGRRLDRHGVTGNLNAVKLYNQEGQLLPVWMSAAGYTCGMFGKYENFWPWSSVTRRIPVGWSQFWCELDPAGYYDYKLIDENLVVTSFGSTAADYETDVLATACADFVTNATSPFFMIWTPGSPHDKVAIAPRHKTLSGFNVVGTPIDDNQADISGMHPTMSYRPLMTTSIMATNRTNRIDARKTVRSIDDGLKTIMDAVAAAGKMDNTIVIYQTDNGRALGRKRIPYNDDEMQKRAPYYYSVDPILSIRYPGIANRTDPGLLRSLDLTATIAAWGGATPNVAIDGSDVSSLIASGTPVHTAVEIVYHGNDEVVLPPWWAMRTEQYKYVEWATSTSDTTVSWTELYDLHSDPAEQNNIAPAQPAVVAQMRTLLAALKADPHTASAKYSKAATQLGKIRFNGQVRTVNSIRVGGQNRTGTWR